MKIILLGCGPSTGVPTVTGHWGACDPRQPRNRRLRSALAVQDQGHTWLVDVGPDIRAQLMQCGINQVQGVLITHNHFDHTAGLGELKPLAYSNGGFCPIPLYTDAGTMAALLRQQPYAFDHQRGGFFQPYVLNLESKITSCAQAHEGTDGDVLLRAVPRVNQLNIFGENVRWFVQDHLYTTSLGFRWETWAYSTDVCALDDLAFKALHGINTWIVDCLQLHPKPESTHAHLGQVLGWIQRITPQPPQAILTHMGLTMDYDALSVMLPDHVKPGYDGLVVCV